MDCGACMFLHALLYVFFSFNCCQGAAVDCGTCMFFHALLFVFFSLDCCRGAAVDCGACMFLHALLFVFFSFNCFRGPTVDCGACMFLHALRFVFNLLSRYGCRLWCMHILACFTFSFSLVVEKRLRIVAHVCSCRHYFWRMSFNCCRGAAADCGACMFLHTLLFVFQLLSRSGCVLWRMYVLACITFCLSIVVTKMKLERWVDVCAGAAYSSLSSFLFNLQTLKISLQFSRELY